MIKSYYKILIQLVKFMKDSLDRMEKEIPIHNFQNLKEKIFI